MDPDTVRRDGFGTLSALPDYLLSVVLMHKNIGIETLATLCCCSKPMRVMCSEEMLWQQHCLRMEHADSQPLVFQANWRQTALKFLAEAAPTTGSGGSTRKPTEHAIQAAARPPPPVALQSDFLYRRWLRCHMRLEQFLPPPPPPGRPDVTRLPLDSLTPAQFRQQYDIPSVPCLLSGAMDNWPKDHDWSFAGLAAEYGDIPFLVSKPGAAAGRATMRMADYVDYIHRQADEEPLYVFDAGFGDHTPRMLASYTIPHVFDQDYFSVLGVGVRPPFRWVVAGPARSGASWHVDPQMTSAWNTLCTGRKRWALYPPNHQPPGVSMVEAEPFTLVPSDAFTSLQWYLEVYPSLTPEQRPLELVQEPGEVVFVPGGWWHMVLNLEDSVAVTQNYVGDANLDRVVSYLAHGSLHYHENLHNYFTRRQLKQWERWEQPGVAPGQADSEDEDGDSSGWETDSAGDLTGEKSEDLCEDDEDLVGMRVQIGPLDKLSEDLGITPCDAVTESAVAVGAVDGRLVVGTLDRSTAQFQRVVVSLTDTAANDDAAANDSAAAGKASAHANGHSIHTNGHVAGQGVNGHGVAGAGLLGEAVGAQAVDGLPLFQWQRDRLMGRWLRLLLAAAPQLRPQVQAALERHVGLQHWQSALGAILTQHSSCFHSTATSTATDSTTHQERLHNATSPADSDVPDSSTAKAGAATATGTPAASAQESVAAVTTSAQGPAGLVQGQGELVLEQLLPEVGADSLVFHQPNGRVIKLIMGQALPVAGLMATTEVEVPAMLNLQPTSKAATSATTATISNHPQQPATAAPLCAPRFGQGVLQVQLPPTDSETDGGTCSDRWQVFPYLVLGDVALAVQHGWQQLRQLIDSSPSADVIHVPVKSLNGSQPHTVDITLTDLATQMGHLLAALHMRGWLAAAARLSGQQGVNGAAASAPGLRWHDVLSHDTWWHDRYGNVWTSSQGHCVVCGKPAVPPADAASLSVPNTTPQPTTAAGGLHSGKEGGGQQAGALWAPFLDFLRSCRESVVEEMQDEDALEQIPTWIKEQVIEFVETHLDRVLSLPASGTTSLPTLIHADVSSNNMFVRASAATTACSDTAATATGPGNGAAAPAHTAAGAEHGPQDQGQSAQLQFMLLDFADSGYGDPLYDFVMLHASVFKFRASLLEVCWAAYKDALLREAALQLAACSLDGAPGQAACAALAACKTGAEIMGVVWPQHGVGLSQAAMLYSLLHEEGALEHMWGKAAQGVLSDMPQTGNTPGVLRLAELVWGALDKA